MERQSPQKVTHRFPDATRQPETHRSSRHSFESQTHLMIPFSPWSLQIPLMSVNLSPTGILVTLNPQELGVDVALEDLYAILDAGDEYSIQIESTFDHLDSPVLTVEIARRNFKSNRLELGLQFTEETEELFCLIHEIEQSQPRAKEKTTPRRELR